jgi:hypothetical protein
MNRICANLLIQNNYKTQFAIEFCDDKVVLDTNPSSLGEWARSRLGNKVALAFLCGHSSIPSVCFWLSAQTSPKQNIYLQPPTQSPTQSSDPVEAQVKAQVEAPVKVQVELAKWQLSILAACATDEKTGKIDWRHLKSAP